LGLGLLIGGGLSCCLLVLGVLLRIGVLGIGISAPGRRQRRLEPGGLGRAGGRIGS